MPAAVRRRQRATEKATAVETQNSIAGYTEGTPSKVHPTLATSSRIIFFFILSLAAILYYSYGINHSTSEQTSNATFAVVDLPGKGKGVIALRDIEQGELVIREKPLFVVPREISSSPTVLISRLLEKVSYTDRQAFFNLSYVHFPANLIPEEHPDEVALAIFQTNAVAAGLEVGIFPRMARLNHGCSGAFNVVYTWREKQGELVVHALKRIKKGMELLTTYTDTKRPRDQRRAFLAQQYDFHCQCSVCTLPDKESRASDTRLTLISDYYGRLAAWGHRQISGPEAVELISKIWRVEEEEGYWSERGQLAADAARVAAAHWDEKATGDWGRLAIEWFTYELGDESEQVLEMRGVVARPQMHPAWGSRERSEVGGARTRPKGG